LLGLFAAFLSVVLAVNSSENGASPQSKHCPLKRFDVDQCASCGLVVSTLAFTRRR
jgi:hypothetical protein